MYCRDVGVVFLFSDSRRGLLHFLPHTIPGFHHSALRPIAHFLTSRSPSSASPHCRLT